MNKRNIILAIVGVILLAGGWIFWGMSKAPVSEVKMGTPFYGSMEKSISATGSVQPQNRLEIKPPIPGRIEKILVEEGQKVKVGDVLAMMSSTERAALLDAARLQGEGAVKEWEDIYKAAPLVAPIDGEVIVKAVNAGQTVTSADAVIVLSDRLIVQAQVDETDIGKVKVGQAAVIGLDAYAQLEVQGKVDHIYYESTTVNNVTIYRVDIVPQAVPLEFRSGMNANVNIIQERKENILLLPLEFVKQDQGRSFVMISQGRGEKPVRAEIQTGLSDDNNIQVIGGLKPDDKVILKTESKLSRGTKAGKAPTSPFMPSGPRRGH
jgi:macrolide-specific efflux system membrane fusion protein